MTRAELEEKLERAKVLACLGCYARDDCPGYCLDVIAEALEAK